MSAATATAHEVDPPRKVSGELIGVRLLSEPDGDRPEADMTLFFGTGVCTTGLAGRVAAGADIDVSNMEEIVSAGSLYGVLKWMISMSESDSDVGGRVATFEEDPASGACFPLSSLGIDFRRW